MVSLDIKISISKLKHYSASLHTKINDKTLLLMIEKFSYYVLELYGRMIEEAIYSKRYKGKWEPLDDPAYIDYIGGAPEISILLAMRESLEVRKVGKYFIISFSKYYEYPGTDRTLAEVIRAIEVGTTKFHARPIIRKITQNINLHMKDLWRGYLVMKGVN